MNGEWFFIERGHRGHYVTGLINKDETKFTRFRNAPDALETNDEAFLEIDDYQALVTDVLKRDSQSPIWRPGRSLCSCSRWCRFSRAIFPFFFLFGALNQSQSHLVRNSRQPCW